MRLFTSDISLVKAISGYNIPEKNQGVRTAVNSLI